MADKTDKLSPEVQKIIDEANEDLPVLKDKKPAKGKGKGGAKAEKAEVETAPAPEPAPEPEVEAEDEAPFEEQVAQIREEMPEPVVEEKITKKAPTKVKGRRVKIFIDNEVGHPNYKFVGHNGVGYQIKRGEAVIVPEGVMNVLENATVTRLVQDDKGNRSMIEHIATPFRMLGYVD